MKTCREMAKVWNVTERTVSALCKSGKIPGAVKKGKSWQIPDDAERPVDGRVSSGNYVKKNVPKEKKPLPIGISDYVRAQSEYYYVDKTMLIKEFLDQKPLVSLFTRPRRFGKTLNMDMIRVFLKYRKKIRVNILQIKIFGSAGRNIALTRENILLCFLHLRMSSLIHGKLQLIKFAVFCRKNMEGIRNF